MLDTPPYPASGGGARAGNRTTRPWLESRPGQELILTTDMSIEGVHFRVPPPSAGGCRSSSLGAISKRHCRDGGNATLRLDFIGRFSTHRAGVAGRLLRWTFCPRAAIFRRRHRRRHRDRFQPCLGGRGRGGPCPTRPGTAPLGRQSGRPDFRQWTPRHVRTGIARAAIAHAWRKTR